MDDLTASARDADTDDPTLGHQRNLFEEVPVAMYRTTPDGAILDANPALVELLGYPHLEALKTADLYGIYVDPSQREECKDLLQSEGVVIGFEEELLHFTGRTIWVHDSARLVRDTDGSVLYYEGALIDITARKRAVEALEHSEERYRTLFDRSPIPLWEEDFSALSVWLQDLRGRGVEDLRRYLAEHPEQLRRGIDLIRIVDINQAALALVGAASKEQLLGGIPTELLNPDGLQAYVEQIMAVWDGRRHLSFDTVGQTFSGNRIEIHLDWLMAPDEEDASQLSRVVVAITDLTERTRAEKALQQSEQRYRELIDTAADAIIGVDHKQCIVLFNKEAKSVFGYRADEIMGQPLVTLLPARLRDAHPRHLERFAQGSDSRRQMSTRPSLTGLRKSGEEFPIEVTISKRPNEGNLEFTAIVRDVTEQERAREALEESLRSKDELIASVSHELRTPLSTVVGFAQLLQDEATGLSAEERAEMIRSIADEGMDLANIVDDLLVAAKSEAGTLTVACVPVDLRAQTAQVVEILDQTVAGQIELTDQPVRALADPARVRQILRNLISNALNYGGDRIRVSIGSDDSTARVQVSDDGPGVPPEQREHIFEPYQRGHDRPGLTASLGLGLTISRRLARLMHGDVTYRYEAGKSIFELVLPKAN